jgi:hypothetical protein
MRRPEPVHHQEPATGTRDTSPPALGQCRTGKRSESTYAALAGGEPHVAVEARMQLARIALSASDAALAVRLAREALRESVKLENLPVVLNAVHCVAECSAQAGDVRGAMALWLFIIAHPQTSDAERRRMAYIVDNVALTDDDRAWAEDQAQRYELRSLADTLQVPPDDDAGIGEHV